MEKKSITLQKLNFVDISILHKAIRYYRFLFALYGIKIQKRELELFAFTAVRGTITPLAARKEFIEIFGTSTGHIENLKGTLVKKGLFVEQDERYRVHPKFVVDFNKDMTIRIDFKLKDEETKG